MGHGRHAEMMEPAHLRKAMTQGQRGERSLREGGRFNFEIRRFLIYLGRLQIAFFSVSNEHQEQGAKARNIA